MTRQGMVGLRRAATVAHAFPGVRLRLREGERTLLEVSRGPTALRASLGPCAFRRMVARAHEELEAGRSVSFLGLAPGTDPVIDVGVRTGDLAHPDGLCRFAVGEVDIHVFATLLSPRRCREVLADRSTSICRHPSATDSARFHRDAATAITLVHAVTPRGGDAVERPVLLEDLMFGCAVEEVVQVLGGAASSG